MKLKYTILLLSFLVCEVFLAQNSDVNTSATMVIANGGLRLREGPSKSSKAITTIPFGTSIKYSDDINYGRDSVSIESNIKGIYIKTIHGFWVKIIHEHYVGYVLDVFLDSRIEIESDKSINNEFVLLYPGCGCEQRNIYNPQKWKWYGYFKGINEKLVSRRVDISYYRTRDGICRLIINPSESEEILFIIGRKSKNLKRVIEVLAKDLYLIDYQDWKISAEELSKYDLEIKQSTKEGWSPDILYLKRDGFKSVLNINELRQPISIKVIGDIDGDSLNDYIISFGENNRIMVLYLTSARKGKELIKAVAVFYAGYCC